MFHWPDNYCIFSMAQNQQQHLILNTISVADVVVYNITQTE